MATAHTGNQLSSLGSKIKLDQAPSSFPSTYWIGVTNVFGNGSTLLQVPQAGTLWVFYEYGNAPAEVIEVWHQGGSVTPIQLGSNNIPVQAGDAFVYQLANPSTDMIKFGLQIQ
jgi:hypothetical protein